MNIFSRKESKGAAFVALAAALWGFDSIVLTPRLYTINVPLVVFLLHLLPFIGMTLIFGRDELKNINKISSTNLFYFFLIALFGGVLGTLSIVRALFLMNFHHLTVVTLIQKLQPIFAILLAKILLREKLGKNFIPLAGIALVCSYLLTFQLTIPEFVENGNVIKASLLSLLAAFSFGSSTVFGKKVISGVNFRTALYLRYGITTFISLFICLVSGSLSGIPSIEPSQWMTFVVIGLTTGSGAILLYYKGLRHISASVATICELSFPISSILFDYSFNNTILSPLQWISLSVMMLTIFRITRNQGLLVKPKTA